MIIHVVVEVEVEAGQRVVFPLCGMVNTGKLNQGRFYELLVVAIATANVVSGMWPHQRLRGGTLVRPIVRASRVRAPRVRAPSVYAALRPGVRALRLDRVRKSNERCSNNVKHLVLCYCRGNLYAGTRLRSMRNWLESRSDSRPRLHPL